MKRRRTGFSARPKHERPGHAEKPVLQIRDFHGTNPGEDLRDAFVKRCALMDRPVTALIKDLKQRGLLSETLVVWMGEFGRTPFREGRTADGVILGRDHHPFSNTMWMTGGGLRPGMTLGATDELGFNVVENPVHVHDVQATILHLLGLDHTRLTYRFQGRDYRLTDVHGKVVESILSTQPSRSAETAGSGMLTH